MNQTTTSGGAGKGSVRNCLTGFILSLLLTGIAFALVMNGGGLGRLVILVGIFSTAAVQILVHLRFFLHLDGSSAARWNVLALVFTALILILFVGGTLWIMFNLKYRMM